jgi:predicted pyridoxine 5'-phosphate oxidase superfamily flavin-nucleotide-binding protein
MTLANVFHEGEVRMHELTGETREAEMTSPMLAPRIAKGAMPFLAHSSLAVLGIENGGDIWCSPMIGAPGFATASDQSTLTFHLRKLGMPLDPWILEAADAKASVGTVFIDLQTRMRYRVNGTLSHPTSDVIELRAREAYGNCPKYITSRHVEWDVHPGGEFKEVSGVRLANEQTKTLRNADLLFMATGHPERGLDASHRGGTPGFVTVANDTTIHFPDYPGNSLYNSLGNLLVDNRIGMLVPDLKRRRALRITGTAAVQFQGSNHPLTKSDGPRLVEVTVSRWNEIEFPVASSHLIDFSPYNP